jgi:hypothetical protein
MTKKFTVNVTANAPTKTIGVSWNAEDELAAVMAAEISNEIDWEILSALMKTAKPEIPEWTKIYYSDTAKKAGIVGIKAWCEEKFGHGFFAFSDRIMIAREEDVVMFMLRWS